MAEDEVIGLRAFARLVGVTLKAIQKAIDAKRFSPEAVVETKRGRSLRLDLALADWERTRTVGNNNRFGELDVDQEKINGSYQPDEVDELDADVDPECQEVADYYHEHALLEKAKREKAEIELEVLRGELVRKDDVNRVIYSFARSVRDGILNIPNRISAELSAEVIKTLKPVLAEHITEKKKLNKLLLDIEQSNLSGTSHNVLQREFRAALENLAKGENIL